MNILIFSPNRLLADSLKSGLDGRDNSAVIAVADTFTALSDTLAKASADVVLIDVTQGIDPQGLNALATQFPDLPWLALGLEGQRHTLACPAREGPSAYVPRSASIKELCQAMAEVAGCARPNPHEAPDKTLGLFASFGRFINPLRA